MSIDILFFRGIIIKKGEDMARNMFKSNHQTVPIPEDEECQLYTLMCVKSVFMLKKFIEKFGDDGRKLLIDVKYKLSNCPLTYLMIRDLVQYSDNWKIEQPTSFGSMYYRFQDMRNRTNFTLYNHSSGIERPGSSRNRDTLSKFEVNRIKLYYGSESEMFNDNEKVIVAKVLWTHAEMLKKYQELKRQQELIKNSDHLRRLY